MALPNRSLVAAFVAGVAVVSAGHSRLATAGPTAAPFGISVQFTLQVDRDPAVTGTLQLDKLGQTCARIIAPIQQRMWLGADASVLYYPESAELFRHKKPSRSVPSFVDAVVVGLGDPVASMPKSARQLSRREAGGVVTTIWRVADNEERVVQHMEVRETATGIQFIQLRSEAGKPLREYRFGDRKRVGRRTVPTEIVATYHAPKTGRRRVETWQLKEPKQSGATSLHEASCLEVRGAVKEKSW